MQTGEGCCCLLFEEVEGSTILNYAYVIATGLGQGVSCASAESKINGLEVNSFKCRETSCEKKVACEVCYSKKMDR